jgi:DoxX-like family
MMRVSYTSWNAGGLEDLSMSDTPCEVSMVGEARASRRTRWVVRILTALVILAFVPSAVLKLMHHPTAIEGFTRMGIPPAAFVPIAILELGCLTLYLLPRTVVLGTVLLTGYLGGAVVANLIGRSDVVHAPLVGLLVWAGAWLRVPELRALVPIRKT